MFNSAFRNSLLAYTLPMTLVFCSTVNGQQAPTPNTQQPAGQRSPRVQRAPAGPIQANPQATGGQRANPRAVPPRQRQLSQQQLSQQQLGQRQGQTPTQMQRAAQQRDSVQQRNLLVQTVPFNLTPAEEKRVDNLLEFWEFSSSKVQTYTTQFEQLEFDPVNGPKDPKKPRSRGFGVIRYSAPDKGEFKLETLGEYTSPKKAGDVVYPQKKVAFDEHWICDGKSVYEFNSKTKQLIETPLPPEMQGKRIADGPLPFMFGGKKDELKERYWIREIKNAKKGQYILEIYPKRRDDAMNYSRVGVIIAENDFLPMALQIYPPNWDAKRNPARTVYSFRDRQTNKPIHRTQQYFNRFVSPKPPLGWKKVVANAGQPAPAPSGQLPRATATKPRATATNLQPTNKAAR